MLTAMATESPTTTPPAPRVALVTGGAKRVGRGVVVALAAAGFDVALTYHRSADDAESLVEQIRQTGRRALAIKADLRDPARATAAIADTVARTFGRLDLLVNNASLYAPGDLRTLTPEALRAAFAIHVESPLLLARAFEPHLRRSRGHIVNMLDLLAERPWPAYLGYCATKAALWNLTLGLARDLAPDVTVNGIAPGVVEWSDDYPPDQREKYLKRVPLARPGTPDDVASAVLYFATAAPYVTGQVLRLDGGRSIT